MSFDLTNFLIAAPIVAILVTLGIWFWRRKDMDPKTKKFINENPSLPEDVKKFLEKNPRESGAWEDRLLELQSKMVLTQGEKMECEYLLRRKYGDRNG